LNLSLIFLFISFKIYVSAFSKSYSLTNRASKDNCLSYPLFINVFSLQRFSSSLFVLSSFTCSSIVLDSVYSFWLFNTFSFLSNLLTLVSSISIFLVLQYSNKYSNSYLINSSFSFILYFAILNKLSSLIYLQIGIWYTSNSGDRYLLHLHLI